MADDNSGCGKCAHYAELKAPFHYVKEGYPDGITVYGFCGYKVKSTFSFYPVYISEGGVCKTFKKRKGGNTE